MQVRQPYLGLYNNIILKLVYYKFYSKYHLDVLVVVIL